MTDPPPDAVALVKVPALLSVRTVGELLDVSTRTVRRRIDEGALPAVREHDRIMVRADELRAYVDRLERVGQRAGRRSRDRPRPSDDFDFLRPGA
jgi:excisionase family DNA binding protein